jgi:ribosome-associated translation inhibitor RaiA
VTRATASSMGAPEVVVAARGDVTDDERTYGKRKMERLMDHVAGPVLFARLELDAHGDPARERPAFAKAELDVNGRVVRAHSTATTMFEAVDALDARLRERLERETQRRRTEQLRHRDTGEHEWHHGEYVEPRPPYFPRPVDEREIVRNKSFAFTAMTPDEAAADLEVLDHDFYLFENVETTEDNVIARSSADPGGYDLLEPSATCSLQESAAPITHSPVRPVPMAVDAAQEALDLSEAPFVFFLESETRRGRVLYRRYDGHYGLIVPADVEV